ncbi:hypothetical protein E5161_01110 [Cohnella pontilimi]|uniref:Uncharacterized protein n=1 Tax=Cohnella pontilimi TaxID=2564100 RepID=A0A4U0FGH7_9BACL|nr:hypothetical protein [Cohnella pontilimi]TJY44027.1 hypothetical protein E5161_01110 [Cohnella pontilimi]
MEKQEQTSDKEVTNLINPSSISIQQMQTEAQAFQSVYPDFISEIERVESTRGKLNDFQLMMAVSYAKNGLGVLSYERRQIINAIFAAFTNIYRNEGRIAANQWAYENFGCGVMPLSSEDTRDVHTRLEELSTMIRDKETELLKLYREYYVLQTYLGEEREEAQV